MFESLGELKEAEKKVIAYTSEGSELLDGTVLRDRFIDKLIYTAVFTEDIPLKEHSIALIRLASILTKAPPSSIYPLYQAFGRKEISGFTVPAINIRTLTYDTARVVFRLANELELGAFVFEIARSEMGYSIQKPDEYSACILAAAIKEGYTGPVFIQGDHYQVNKKHFTENPGQELASIKDLIKDSIKAGFYNIDIDASTIVDLEKSDLSEQQRANYETTAELTKFIRDLEIETMTISIGGEIGHIGGKNSTVEDFEAFMDGYLPLIENYKGISKVSVQTGTSHGGIPLPDGSMADITLDFSVLSSIGDVAREKYHMGGAVQHGASTLPNSLFGEFVKAQTLEIHLATGFQNIVFATMPEAIKSAMETWVKEHMQDEKSPDMTEQQFIYKMRKKAFGPFKKTLWQMSDEEKSPIRSKLEEQFRFLFTTLNCVKTKDVVSKYYQ